MEFDTRPSLRIQKFQKFGSLGTLLDSVTLKKGDSILLIELKDLKTSNEVATDLVTRNDAVEHLLKPCTK